MSSTSDAAASARAEKAAHRIHALLTVLYDHLGCSSPDLGAVIRMVEVLCDESDILIGT